MKNELPSSDRQIRQLLRLKKYEKPSDEYFEDFLFEFQRRQRADAMKPSWRESLMSYFSDLVSTMHVPSYAYGAAALMAVVASVIILSGDEVADMPGAPLASISQPANSSVRMDLMSRPEAAISQPVTIPSQRLVGTLPPHYELQRLPSSQHEPFSF
ncbi:MAG: hypothetical protein ACK5LK_06750 [Chthoniobacterales bacterium]